MPKVKLSGKNDTIQLSAPNTSVGEMSKTNITTANQVVSSDSCRATLGTEKDKNKVKREVSTPQRERRNRSSYELRGNERIDYGNFKKLNERQQLRYRAT